MTKQEFVRQAGLTFNNEATLSLRIAVSDGEQPYAYASYTDQRMDYADTTIGYARNSEHARVLAADAWDTAEVYRWEECDGDIKKLRRRLEDYLRKGKDWNIIDAAQAAGMKL